MTSGEQSSTQPVYVRGDIDPVEVRLRREHAEALKDYLANSADVRKFWTRVRLESTRNDLDFYLHAKQEARQL